jgi:hypothetical protein
VDGLVHRVMAATALDLVFMTSISHEVVSYVVFRRDCAKSVTYWY